MPERLASETPKTTAMAEEGKPSGGRSTVSTVALVAGAIFVILAGCIFATTTWRMLPSMAKVILVPVLAMLFFLASLAAEKLIGIRRTAMACQLLGCVFLFLTMVTAGYFNMLGPVFTLNGDGWWCVLGLGSMLAQAAMGLGFLRFNERIYKRIFEASTIGAAAFLIWQFAGCILLKFADALTGGPWIVGFCIAGMTIMAMVSGFVAWKYENPCAEAIFSLVVLELFHYGILYLNFGIAEQLFLMAAVTAGCFFAHKLPGLRDRKESCRMTAQGIATAILSIDTLILAAAYLFMMEDNIESVLTLAVLAMMGLVMREWGKRFAGVRAAIPFVMWYAVIPATVLLNDAASWDLGPEWLTFAFVCGLAAWDAVREDVWGYGILGIGSFMLFVAGLTGDASWQSAWALVLGLYGCIFAWRAHYKRAVGILILLALNCLWTDQLACTLILEGICLAVFLMAHRRGNGWTARIAGGLMVAVAVYAMKDFWFQIAWWVYLLIAGIGLIVFAAVREKKD